MNSREFAAKNKDEDTEKSRSKYREIISTLPKNEGPAENTILNLYNYQGSWYRYPLCMNVMALQDNFKSHSTDILLATNPKSGTHWFQALLFTVVNRKLHPLNTSHSEPHPLVKFRTVQLVPILGFDASFSDLDDLPIPRLLATHIPFWSLPKSVINSRCKIVYVCRNPKDQFVSLWHFLNKFGSLKSSIPMEVLFEQFLKGCTGFGPVWDHTIGYWKESIENPERVLFMVYEEMKAEPVEQLKRLAEFIGFPFSEQEEKDGVADDIIKFCSIENMKALEVNNSGVTPYQIPHSAFYREGKVGGWTNHLTPEMAKKLDQITELKFNGTGIVFP